MGLSPKPLTVKLHERHVENRAASFGLVAYPNEPLAVPEAISAPAARLADEQAKAHPYDVFARLGHLRCDTDSEKQTRNDLLAAVTPLLLQAEAFEREIVAARSVTLETEWKEVKKECRKQAAVVRKLDADWNAAEASIRAWSSQYDHDLTELQAMRSATLPSWPTDKEIAAKETRIAQAKAQAEVSSQERATALQKRQQIEHELKLAQEKMNELTAKEVRLKHALSGAPYNDFEFGLAVK